MSNSPAVSSLCSVCVCVMSKLTKRGMRWKETLNLFYSDLGVAV